MALTFPLAGCAGGGDTAAAPAEEDDEDTLTEGDGTPADTDGDDESTPTETDTPESAADVVIGEPTLDYDDSGFSTYAYADVELTNQGDGPSGEVRLTIDWFDPDDNYLDDSTETIGSLNPGEAWKARVYGILVEAEDVDSVEASAEFKSDPPIVPDGVEVVSSELLAGGDNVKIRGEVANNMDHEMSYISFHGKVLDKEGAVLGEAWTNESEIPSGQTVQFDPEWNGRERNELAADHEVVLSDGAF